MSSSEAPSGRLSSTLRTSCFAVAIACVGYRRARLRPGPRWRSTAKHRCRARRRVSGGALARLTLLAQSGSGGKLRTNQAVPLHASHKEVPSRCDRRVGAIGCSLIQAAVLGDMNDGPALFCQLVENLEHFFDREAE